MITAHPVVVALAAALRAAGDQLGLPIIDLDIDHVGGRDWRDGCLECPEPDEPCTDDVIPGYLVIVTGAGRRLAYHADRDGNIRACRALRVAFERGGGFIWWPTAVTVDFGDAKALPRDEARRLQALVDMAIESARFFELPAELTPPGPQPYYALTIETHRQEHSVRGDPSAFPAALGPLIEWLTPRGEFFGRSRVTAILNRDGESRAMT